MQSVSCPHSITLQIGEQTVVLGKPDLSVFFEAADRVQSLKTRRFAEVLERSRSLEGDALRETLSLAFEWHQRIVTNSEIAEWLQSPEGDIFLFWHAARKTQRDLEEPDARSIYQQLNADQLVRIARFFAESLCL